jgi:hydroxybutyrate-dimer hydrolase
MRLIRRGPVASAVAASLLLAGCWGNDTYTPEQNLKPSFVGAITKSTYDGVSDDLLTGGLGKTGLGAAAAPPPASPTAPTAAELRRLAIFNNYRAILDITTNGGYGVLYGPNIDVNGNNTLGEGKIPGNEYLAYDDDGTGLKNVTLMVQVPTSFNQDRACIITATSSGSRGVYGAIGSAGEWGLKRGCAVVYVDKGTGNGVHDLATNTVNLQNGVRQSATTAGKASNFTAIVNAADLAAYNAAFPNRIAVKHAHSQQNPEKDWGTNTLDGIRLGLYIINEEFAGKNSDGSTKIRYTKDNTIVIASSVSNGGAASLAAAEQDTDGLIDGVAVAEPVIELTPNPALTVKRGNNVLVGGAKPLYDYFTIANLYEPCASQSTQLAGSYGIPALLPVPALAQNRCRALKNAGLLQSTTVAAQADESLQVMYAAGWEPDSNNVIATMYTQVVPPVTNTYANTYGKFGVTENLCDLSFAGLDAQSRPAPLAAAALAQIFGTGNGVPPNSGINIINNVSVGGPISSPLSISPSTGLQDYNFDAALCQRNLWTGTDAKAVRLQNGVKETIRTGNLHGKPAIIVHGRADGYVLPNANSRPYFGTNKIVEGAASKLSYIEVTNAQHFDAFIALPTLLPGYDSAFVPLHVYFIRAMDAMWATLTTNTPVPPSQVVRTTPRGGTPGSAPPISAANVPPISAAPPAGNQITFSNNTVTIPD